jgi:hypothetical protein
MRGGDHGCASRLAAQHAVPSARSTCSLVDGLPRARPSNRDHLRYCSSAGATTTAEGCPPIAIQAARTLPLEACVISRPGERPEVSRPTSQRSEAVVLTWLRHMLRRARLPDLRRLQCPFPVRLPAQTQRTRERTGRSKSLLRRGRIRRTRLDLRIARFLRGGACCKTRLRHYSARGACSSRFSGGAPGTRDAAARASRCAPANVHRAAGISTRWEVSTPATRFT